MLKHLGAFLLILAVFLGACQSAPVSPIALPTTEIVPEQTRQVATSTKPPPSPEVSAAPAAEQTLELEETNCTVVSRQPTPGPTEKSIVPAVSEADWVLGPGDAKVTFIEYGDFQ